MSGEGCRQLEMDFPATGELDHPVVLDAAAGFPKTGSNLEMSDDLVLSEPSNSALVLLPRRSV